MPPLSVQYRVRCPGSKSVRGPDAHGKQGWGQPWLAAVAQTESERPAQLCQEAVRAEWRRQRGRAVEAAAAIDVMADLVARFEGSELVVVAGAAERVLLRIARDGGRNARAIGRAAEEVARETRLRWLAGRSMALSGWELLEMGSWTADWMAYGRRARQDRAVADLVCGGGGGSQGPRLSFSSSPGASLAVCSL